MISNYGSLVLLVVILLQADSAATLVDGLTIAERLQLNRQVKIEDRIKIYESVSSRYHKSVEQAAETQNFERIPDFLQNWSLVLSKSLADITQNIDRKKRSNALIKYEIRVRKSIVDIGDARIKAPVEHQEYYDYWIDHAEHVRKQFVEILFPR
jgi:hypothetical protein